MHEYFIVENSEFPFFLLSVLQTAFYYAMSLPVLGKDNGGSSSGQANLESQTGF